MNNLNVNFKAEVEGWVRKLPVPWSDIPQFCRDLFLRFWLAKFLPRFAIGQLLIYTDCLTLCHLYLCDDTKKICFPFRKVEAICDSSVDHNPSSWHVVERAHERVNCKGCNLDWRFQPDLSNRTKPNKKPIEPNRTPIVRLGWAIEQNRTPILLWVRFSNQSNQYNRTKSN